MEPARRESCPSGQRRAPSAPGDDNFPSPDDKSFHICTTPTNRRRKCRSPGSIPPRMAWEPQPHWLVADWLGLMEPAGGEVAPPAKVEVAPLTGRLRCHPRIRYISISLQFQQTGDQDGDPTGRYRPTWCGNPNQGRPLLIGVRESSGPYPMGVRSSGSLVNVIKYCTATCL